MVPVTAVDASPKCVDKKSTDKCERKRDAGECRKPLVERWQCAATCGWQWCQPPEATCKDRRAWCVKRVAKHGVKACAASAKVALTCVHSCGGCPKPVPDAAKQLM